MKTKSEQTSVTPTVEYLTDILDKITAGTLRVPNFQRPFVWKPNDMIALFESIYKGYPVGSLLFWKADKNYNTLSHIGPYKLKEVESLPINYILDGHQRLSTLYGVLSNLPKDSKNDDYRWDVYYDLLEDNFLHIKGNSGIEPYYFPLKSLLKTTEFLKATRKIFSKFDAQGEELIEKAEKLLQAFRGYRIAITQIQGGDLESAVHIFSRLNTKGVQMSIDRMYSALTYKEGVSSFNLSYRIDDIKTKLAEHNFGDIDRMIIFRAILAAAGKNLYTEGRFDLFKDTENISEIVNNCEESLVEAVKFLSNRLQIPSSSFLPHSLQLIILSEFFRIELQPSEEKLRIIEKWFWVTSFIGMDIVNSSKKRQTLSEVITFAGIEENEIEGFKFETVDFEGEAISFPSRFVLNGSRVRAFAIFLASLKPISLINYNEYNTHEMLGEYGYKAFNYITPPHSISIESKNLLSSPANRMISLPKNRRHIKRNIAKLMEDNLFSVTYNSNKILESHGINQDAANALLNGDTKLFIEYRLANLIELEKEFIRQKGIKPNQGNSTTDVFPDTD